MDSPCWKAIEEEGVRKKVVFFLIRELQRERNGLGGSATKKNWEKKPWPAGRAAEKNRWRLTELNYLAGWLGLEVP